MPLEFVDNEKAFDLVQTLAVHTSLLEQEIEEVHIALLKEIYTNSSLTIPIHKESNQFNIRRGVRP